MSTHQQGGVAICSERPNAGIDVSKQHLDVCLGHQAVRLANDSQGWSGCVALLCEAGVDLVAIEATGGYGRGVLCALQTAGLHVARVNHRQARDFAQYAESFAKDEDAGVSDETETAERSLLHVAATRAKRHLFVLRRA